MIGIWAYCNFTTFVTPSKNLTHESNDDLIDSLASLQVKWYQLACFTTGQIPLISLLNWWNGIYEI